MVSTKRARTVRIDASVGATRANNSSKRSAGAGPAASPASANSNRTRGDAHAEFGAVNRVARSLRGYYCDVGLRLVCVTPVITGLGCVSCLGTSVEAFATALLESRSGIGPITRFDTRAMPFALCRARGRPQPSSDVHSTTQAAPHRQHRPVSRSARRAKPSTMRAGIAPQTATA